MNKLLDIKNLRVSHAGKELLHELNFSVNINDTVVIVGPNGAGKTTLARAISSDEYNHSGEIILSGQNVVDFTTDAKARAGIFLSYQEPVQIPGISVSELIRSALEAHGEKLSLRDFNIRLNSQLEKVGLNPFIAQRDLDSSLSGGERKKIEILQMLMLRPKLAILDEIDSGLDFDSTRTISKVLKEYQEAHKCSFVIITHNYRILQELNVTKVAVLNDGRIEKIGGIEILDEIKKFGFKNA